jgi:Holliday junction resolvase RusA-like endonuclease
MKLKFTVIGHPQGKGRPIFSTWGGRVSARTPEKTVAYENDIKAMYRRAHPNRGFPEGVMLDLRVIAYFGVPNSASQKRRAAMLAGEIRPTKKPDADNILKVIADSLNGLAYHDDSQLVDTQIRKFYSVWPRVEVTIQETGGTQHEQLQIS